MKIFISLLLLFCTTSGFAQGEPLFEEEKFGQNYVSSWFWKRYKTSFIMEKISIYFPHTPYVNRNADYITAYAFDDDVIYSLIGSYPPIANIDPVVWFDEVLCCYSQYPYILVASTSCRTCEESILDYTAYDDLEGLVIKGRVVITPYNAYTLTCVKPDGRKDYFDYFLDNFRIECEYHY